MPEAIATTKVYVQEIFQVTSIEFGYREWDRWPEHIGYLYRPSGSVTSWLIILPNRIRRTNIQANGPNGSVERTSERTERSERSDRATKRAERTERTEDSYELSEAIAKPSARSARNARRTPIVCISLVYLVSSSEMIRLDVCIEQLNTVC